MLGLPDGPPERVTGVTLDSRGCAPGTSTPHCPGFTTHGARFAAMAQAAGAAAILTDPAGADLIGADRRRGAARPGRRRPARRARCGRRRGCTATPREDLATTGITGTNGKTTASYLLDAALRAAGAPPG